MPRLISALLVACVPCAILAPPALSAEPTPVPTPEQIEFFEKHVRPVLAENCFGCHGPKKQEASLRLDSRAGMLKGGDTGPAVVAGEPGRSELVDAINYAPDGYQMPPKGKLPQVAIDALTKWIEMGAPWPGDTGDVTIAGNGFDIAERSKHWAFQPIERAEVPGNDTGWARNAIDQFIAARLSDAELQPAAETDRRTLLRRVTFDLTGLPPTREEIAAFLADESPTAYERVVDRLLASPRYGERWARHWMDLVRFAETSGHEFDFEIPYATPYRDYVIRAFNDDVPYDRFVAEHVAGDLLATPRRRTDNRANESVIGTAFWHFAQAKHSPVDIRAEECDRIDNQIDVFGKTFLGLTIACARCHDHKFDAISTADYYALSGVMQSSRTNYAIINPPDETVEPARRITRAQRDLQPELAKYTTDRLGRVLAELRDPGSNSDSPFAKLLETAAADATHPLHALALLTAEGDLAARDRLRRSIVERLGREREAATRETPDSVTFATFDDGRFDGWYTSGHAWGDRPTAAGDVIVQDDPRQPVRELVSPGLAHSGVVSPVLEGELRSRTFTIEHPIAWYRVARHGGKPNPGRGQKNGQIHVIIDGFQLIQNPLYGQLTVNVANDGQFRWVRQDLSRFLGKTAYIEIEDEDDGYLVVDRIVFSKGAHPAPESPNAHLLSILDTELATKNPSGRFHEAIASALELWTAGKLTDHPKQAGAIELINALLVPQLADDEPLDDPAVALGAMEARQAVTSARSRIRPAERVVATADGSGENVNILVRGNHTKEGEMVPRRFLEVFHGEEPENSGSGRLELANRLADPANPLVARVVVNRLWQHHFGRGIVASPDNFGILGIKPTHPELLDWLATELVRRRWSLKAMHRLMVTSATYRQSSELASTELEAADPGNLLLHRANVRRLEGEAIRDAILAVSGRLDQRFFGHSILPHLTPFMEGRGRPGSGPLDGDGRRSVYLNVRRNFLAPLFLAFDFPTPFTTTGRRSTSNVPAQALTLMNNPLVVQQSGVWSRNLLAAADAPEARVQLAYESAFARSATDAELDAALAFVAEQGREYGDPNHPRAWQDLCHVLFNVKEFVFVP